MRRTLILALSSATLFGVASSSQATLLGWWNFNTAASLLTASGQDVSVSLISMTASWTPNSPYTTFAGSTVNAVGADVAGQSLGPQGNPGGTGTGTANNGTQLVIRVESTTNTFSGISLSFATQRTSTGFTGNTLEASLNGSTWTSVDTNVVPASSFATYTNNLSNAFDGTGAIWFRYTLNGATTTSGNNRIDNVQVNATLAPVPEPVSLLTVGVGAAGLWLRRRKRSV